MPRMPLQPESDLQTLEPCLVGPSQTASFLSEIASNVTPASVFAEGADAPALSVKIRHVTSNGFQLYSTDDEPETWHRLEAGNAIFVGFHGRYKIQFKISHINRLASPPGVAGKKQASGIYFDCSFPQQIWRINRREEFRATTMESADVSCEIRAPHRSTILAKAFDLSANGVCIELPEGTLDATVGTVWHDCTMRLGENTHVVPCSLVVMTIEHTEAPAGHVHIGCKVHLKNPAYAAEYQTMNFEVQRAERLARAQGRLKLV